MAEVAEAQAPITTHFRRDEGHSSGKARGDGVVVVIHDGKDDDDDDIVSVASDLTVTEKAIP